MTIREQSIRSAKIYLTEARSRRESPHQHQREFAVTLLQWAANARNRITKPVLFLEVGETIDMFGGVA